MFVLLSWQKHQLKMADKEGEANSSPVAGEPDPVQAETHLAVTAAVAYLKAAECDSLVSA